MQSNTRFTRQKQRKNNARLEALFKFMLSQEGVRISGERRFALRKEHMKKGVEIPDKLYEELQSKYI